MPALNFNILDGQLGQLPASIANAVLHAGVCANGTVNTMYGLGDTSVASSTLGPGPLTEDAADTISVAGACFACPINPSVAGSIGAVTHLGTGAGTVTPTLAPAVQILAKITTGGALGTMRVAFSIGGGGYGTPVVSTPTAFSILVPGTLTVLTFSAQTYTVNDVWAITTAGGITVAGAGTAGWVTQASSPLEAFDLFVTVTTAGALGAGQVTVSVDGQGGNSTSDPILIPSGAVYVIPGTGIVLTFASTFVAGDTYEATCVNAGFSGGDVTAMLTASGNSPNKFILVHIVGQGANTAAAVSLASTIDTSMTAFQTSYRYIFGVVENPQGESDATIEAGWASFVSARIMVCCTDVLHVSSLSGNIIRRNCALPIVSRLAATNSSVDPGWVGGGSLKNVKAIFRDEAKTPGLALNRITCMTTQPTKQGYFSSTGLMMASSGSDFASVMNRRVMDVACTATVGALINNINQALLVNPQTGGIYDPEAEKIEGYVEAQINAALLTNSPPDISGPAQANINRTENILQTGDFTIAIGIIPKGYAHKITVNIGFVNPAFSS